MRKSRLRLSVASFVILFGMPFLASAHATPVMYEPAASSVSAEAPQRVRIRFSERIEPAASSVRVYAPAGGRADDGGAVLDPADPRDLSIAFRAAEEGTYAVSWQVVSADDGHFTKGAFSFSLGKETASSTGGGGFQISHSSATPEAVTIWLELLGHAALVGLLACLAFVWRPLRRLAKRGDENTFGRAADLLVVVSCALGFAGAAAGFAIKSFELATAQSAAFPAAAAAYAATASGTSTVVRAATLVLLLLFYARGRRTLLRAERLGRTEIILWLLLLVDAFARARVSHAAASHLLPHLSIAINFLHLLAKDVWVGGALAMAVAVVPAVAASRTALGKAAALWSRTAAAAIGAAGVTGAYVVWLHLKGPANLFSTDWGGRCMLLALAGASAFAVRAWLAWREDHALAGAAGSEAYRDGQRLEAWLGSLMLLVTAFIIITTPPLGIRPAFERRAVSEGIRLTLTETAYDHTSLLIIADDARTGRPVPLEDVIVTLENPGLSIGPVVAETTRRWPGGFTFHSSALSPPGDWRVDVTARKREGYDATASFTLAAPRELEEGRISATARTYGVFDTAMAVSAAFFAMIGIVLFRRASSLLRGTADVRPAPELPPRAVSPALAVALFVPFILFGARMSILKGTFQHRCEANGHMWTPSVPMRAGVATSPVAISGCSVGMGAGAFHFAEHAEYAYFVRADEDVLMWPDSPRTITAGEPAVLKLEITEGSRPATDLVVEHDRLLHVIAVSRDFSVYSHVHIEDAGPITDEMRRSGVYPVVHTFPQAGPYLVAADFAVRSRHVSSEFIVDVAGQPPIGIGDMRPTLDADVDGYHVRLTTVPRKLWARRNSLLRFTVEKDGAPVTDLQPYLSAAMHVGIVWSDFDQARASAGGPSLTSWFADLLVKPASAHDIVAQDGAVVNVPDFLHAHGRARQSWIAELLSGGPRMLAHASPPEAFGPDVDANVTIPTPGFYVIFAEFKHGGKVHVAKFVVEAFDAAAQ